MPEMNTQLSISFLETDSELEKASPNNKITVTSRKNTWISKKASQRVRPGRIFISFIFSLFAAIGFLNAMSYTARYFYAHNIESSFRPWTAKTSRRTTDQVAPSRNPWHLMNDSELLVQASVISRLTMNSFNPEPRIAFMFLTKGPLPMAPMWERFFRGKERFWSIYIHSLPSHKPDFDTSSVFYGRQIPSRATDWGQISLCDAERRLVANALLDHKNEWFVLLSESCIPLQSFDIAYSYISKSQHSFVGSVDVHGPTGRGRYSPQMAPKINLTQWRKGSQWFQVNRKLATIIIEDTEFYSIFSNFCWPDCYSDEHYFPTMLGIHAGDQLANRSLTWVYFQYRRPHPVAFAEAHITRQLLELILQGTNCSYNGHQTSRCFLFARKFGPNSLQPLLDLTSEVLGF